MQKNELNHSITQINSKWIEDLNVRPEVIILIEENKGNTLFDVGLSSVWFCFSETVSSEQQKQPLASRTAAAAAKSLQLCPTLCDPMDSSPPGTPVPGILQARTLEWVAISFSSV